MENTNAILETKLTWLLGIAKKVQQYFKPTPDALTLLIQKTCKKRDALIATQKAACDTYQMMIISDDPRSLLIDVITQMRTKKDTAFQDSINPITIIAKLYEREYIFDVNGTRICYVIKSSVASNSLMKSIACRSIYNIRNYQGYIDSDSNAIKSEILNELYPEFSYENDTKAILGGKKKKVFTPAEKSVSMIRLNIISRLKDYIRNNLSISQGLIFVHDLHESKESAISIIYTGYKYKEAVVDYLKLLIVDSYKDYKFKSFLHSDFYVPHDFRMKKYSLLINDKVTSQPIYLVNMYNCAEYEPVPCVKSIIHDSYLNIAHPLVKLRFMYIDMYMLEHKTKSTKHENMFKNRISDVINAIIQYDKTPTWIGNYVDEDYEKSKFNMSKKDATLIETHIV